MTYIIGVDLGGTKINTVLMNKEANVIRRIKLSTPKNKSVTIKKIIDSVNFVSYSINKKKILGVGVGVPGILNKERSKILRLPNLPSWKNVNLKKILEKKLKFKILMENDANCMALGEFLFGYGKNKKIKHLVCVTLGTGIGGGIIINKEIYNGEGNAAEIGHTTIESKGFKCSCGNYGCLSEYVAVRGLHRIAKKLKIKEDNVIKIQELAKRGNKKAKKVYEIAGNYLGIGLSNIVKILDPEVIVIGGGISNSGNILLKPAYKEMQKRTFFRTCKIARVKLGDNSGAIGAAALFIK